MILAMNFLAVLSISQITLAEIAPKGVNEHVLMRLKALDKGIKMYFILNNEVTSLVKDNNSINRDEIEKIVYCYEILSDYINTEINTNPYEKSYSKKLNSYINAFNENFPKQPKNSIPESTDSREEKIEEYEYLYESHNENSYNDEGKYDEDYIIDEMEIQTRDSISAEEVYYYEDFTSYDDGDLPAGWTGGDNLAVKTVHRDKVLKDFVNGNYDVTTKNIHFPNRFILKIVMKHQVSNPDQHRGKKHDWYGNYRDTVIKIHLGEYQVHVGDREICAGAKGKYPNWVQSGVLVPSKTFSLGIRKEGNIFSVFVNESQVLVGRFKDIQFNNIRFESKSKFEIYSIKVERIGA